MMTSLTRRRSLIAATLAHATLAACGHAQGDWSLIWADEFDGTALDPAKWEYQLGDGSAFGIPGWGNNELQYYRDVPANASVSSGSLKITARAESFGGKSYTSARIRTANRFEFTYGRIEGRIRLPSTTGIWPAFWMLPTASPYGGWAAGGEIDIMESVNFADRIYGTIHYGGPFPANVKAGGQYAPGTDFSQGFHVYTVEWDPNQMRWYVDGILYKTIDREVWYSTAAQTNPRAPFDQDFHLLLNVAVGGNFPGNPNGSSQFPQTMEVDWVRVYQRERQPFGGTLATIPGTVEAENFDEGYPGQVYVDADAFNIGGVYRPEEDVDIEATAGGGFNVGWIDFAESMQYTVDVRQAGEYTITARVASASTGGSFVLNLDGVPVGPAFLVPATGGFQTWTEISRTATLAPGLQVLEFQNISLPSAEFNLDRITFTRNGGDCPGDVNGDGVLDPSDFTAWVVAYNAGDAAADQNGDGEVSPADFTAWVQNYNADCG
ncbi:MAG: family 16 glycosylhydrolase [Phycisphaerales bacterium]